MTTEQAETWDRDLDDLFTTIGHRFGRVEPRRRMRDYVRGLLDPVARKNSWQLAENAGHSTPNGLQHLLSRARWDPDEIRDDLQVFVAERLGRPDGVLIVDDTGFLKKGTTSAGVQRQYSGTAGRRGPPAWTRASSPPGPAGAAGAPPLWSPTPSWLSPPLPNTTSPSWPRSASSRSPATNSCA